MNVDGLLKQTLEALGVPVARLKYDGKAKTFITYQLVVGRDIHFTDDDNEAEEFTYRVDIYSKTDYISLMRRVKTELKSAGFFGIVFDPEVFESETGYFHIPVEIKYMEV